MNHNERPQVEDRADLGAASVETRGQIQGSTPDGFENKLVGGMSDE